MAELKDLIVNGSAKFNGSVDLSEPVSGSMSLYPSFVTTLDSSSNNYYHIGSIKTDETSESTIFCKVLFFEAADDNYDTEIEIKISHTASGEWTKKSIGVSNPLYVSALTLIEASSTEVQLWVKLSSYDSLYIEVYNMCGKEFVLSKSSSVQNALPSGKSTLGKNNTAAPVAYGTCNTSSSTAVKSVSVNDDSWILKTGSLITIKFINTNTACDPKLNVNNAGSYPVIYDSSEITSSNLKYAGSAGRYITYAFTGSSFVFIGWSIDSDSTYDDVSDTSSGLMTPAQKKKLDEITASADAVAFTPELTSGIKIGTLMINGKPVNVYSPAKLAYDNMTGASADASGKAGLVPAPSAGNQDKYLRGDGTWSTPTDTKYNNATAKVAGLMSAADKAKLDGINTMTGALNGTDGKAGLVPAPSAGDQDKFLKADGTWGTPTDTKYSEATTSKAGLMSAADKTKLDSLSGSGDEDFSKYYQPFSDLFRLM